jgi:anti-sigma B factor antagonist
MQAAEIHVQPFYLRSITAGADCAMLRIGGEVDVYTAPQLRERVTQLLAGGARHLIADLREVDFWTPPAWAPW